MEESCLVYQEQTNSHLPAIPQDWLSIPASLCLQHLSTTFPGQGLDQTASLHDFITLAILHDFVWILSS